ncbi:MAG: hypothetical protein ACK4Z9_08010, partial [Thermodesulfovibrionales bacterium]
NHTTPPAITSPAIPIAFKPSLSSDKLDIATFLFGYVDEGTKSARAGRVIIEDAYFDKKLLKDYKMLDIAGEAIMGGPRPRANWWYMRPKEVWDRSVRSAGRALQVIHFVGDEFWGRKFYYHQNPEKCIAYYTQNDNWNVYQYNIQCLDKDKSTDSFRIYFDRVPEKLIKLLCTCLCMPPGSKMRHKLGYGKPFGYGSVEFSISKIMLRTEKPASFPEPLISEDLNILIKTWKDNEINEFIDESSLNKLARILTWDANDNRTLIFTYPPFNRQNFQKVIQRHEFPTSILPLAVPKNTVNESEAIEIARALWNIKKPLHFQLYQARARGYNQIKNRKP